MPKRESANELAAARPYLPCTTANLYKQDSYYNPPTLSAYSLSFTPTLLHAASWAIVYFRDLHHLALITVPLLLMCLARLERERGISVPKGVEFELVVANDVVVGNCNINDP